MGKRINYSPEDCQAILLEGLREGETATYRGHNLVSPGQKILNLRIVVFLEC